MIGAEAHAVFAQYRPFRLFQPLYFVGNPLPVENAERLDQLERDTTRNAVHVDRCAQREQQMQPARYPDCSGTTGPADGE